MRFLFSVDDTWNVVLTCPELGAGWRYTRAMRRLTDLQREVDFPLPPLDALPAEGAPHAALCRGDGAGLLALRQVQDDLARRRTESGQVARFGAYLFDTLIGRGGWQAAGQGGLDAWQAILDAAQGLPAIELALSWSAGQRDLHRLNWEMLRAGDDFVAAPRAGQPFAAITRVVAGASPAPRSTGLPPRLLFVVGSQLTDPRIRAGAECLGLLHQLRLKDESRGLHSLIVPNATVAKARRAIANFRPDVVYFICHGNEDFLALQLDPGEAGEAGEDFRRVRAHNLLELLGAEGQYPPIVVLSACYSGALMSPQQIAPLGVALVAGGVPIVVGMGGRVADRACRLFTHRFGEAILKGEPLVLATAQGRRSAAFDDIYPPDRSVDWAFPTLFMAESVPGDFVPARWQGDSPAMLVARRIKAFQVAEAPVFCGRDELIRALYDLIRPGSGPAVLAVRANSSASGLGRTRLLKELAAHALHNQVVPCLVSQAYLNGWSSPQDVMHLARLILSGIGFTRVALQLGESEVDQITLLDAGKADWLALAQNPLLDNVIRKRLVEGAPLPVNDPLRQGKFTEAVRRAIIADLQALLAAARAKHPDLRERQEHLHGQLLLLFDDVHQFSESLIYDLLGHSNGLLGADGLGTPDERALVVLVFSYEQGMPAYSALKSALEHAEGKDWLLVGDLSAFSGEGPPQIEGVEAGEDMLALERVLLHPYSKVMPNFSEKSLAFNSDAALNTQKAFKFLFRSHLLGLPGNFVTRSVELYTTAQAALMGGFVVEADYELELKKAAQTDP